MMMKDSLHKCFFQSIREFACIAYLDGNVADVNIEWRKKMAIKEVPFNLKEVIHENDFQIWDEEWQKFILDRSDFTSMSCRVKVQSGNFVSVLWNISKSDDFFFLTGRESVPSDMKCTKYESLNFDVNTEIIISQFDINEEVTFLRSFFENTSDAVYLTNKNGDFEYVNGSACKMLGYSREEINQMKVSDIDSDFVLDDQQRTIFNYVKEKQKQNWIFEAYHKKKNGDLISVEINTIFVNLGDNPYGLCFVRDITFRKKSESALRKRKKLLMDSQRIARLGSFEIHLKNSTVIWSDELYALFGYSKDEIDLDLNTICTLIFNSDEKKLEDCLIKISREKCFYENEFKVLKKDGELIHIFLAGDVSLDKDGEVERIIGVIQDVSDRKKYEEDLTVKQRLLVDSHRIARMGAWELDLKTFTIVWNKELFDILDVDSSNLKPSLDLIRRTIHPDDKEKFEQSLLRTIETKHCEDLELTLLLSDGRIKYVVVVGEIVLDEYDNPVSLYGIIQDVTASKVQKQQLIEAKEHAEQSDRLKSAFLANVSHEIRTPMNAIIGFSSFLKDPDNTMCDVERYADIIISSGDHLLALINDIIDISKIDAGQVDIVKSNLNINRLLDEVNTFFYSFLVAKNKTDIELILNVPKEDIFAYTDEMRLKQILFNLIGNAIKFTECGYVKIEFRRQLDMLKFNILDTGIGIPCDKMEVIFERFQQGACDTEKVYGGTGLGLAIAKACVQLLGGKITVESEVGKGTDFYFEIKV